MRKQIIPIKKIIREKIRQLIEHIPEDSFVFEVSTNKDLNKKFREIVDDDTVTVQTARPVYLTTEMNNIWKPHTFNHASVERTKRLAYDAGHTVHALIKTYWHNDYNYKTKVRRYIEDKGVNLNRIPEINIDDDED